MEPSERVVSSITGSDFDQAWFVLLKPPPLPWESSEGEDSTDVQGTKASLLFREDGTPRSAVIRAAKLMGSDNADRVAAVINDPNSYTGGLHECLMNYCGFIFYKDGVVVREVVPNFSGGDLRCFPRPSFKVNAGMSESAFDTLASVAFEEAGGLFRDDIVAPAPPPHPHASEIMRRRYIKSP